MSTVQPSSSPQQQQSQNEPFQAGIMSAPDPSSLSDEQWMFVVFGVSIVWSILLSFAIPLPMFQVLASDDIWAWYRTSARIRTMADGFARFCKKQPWAGWLAKLAQLFLLTLVIVPAAAVYILVNPAMVRSLLATVFSLYIGSIYYHKVLQERLQSIQLPWLSADAASSAIQSDLRTNNAMILVSNAAYLMLLVPTVGVMSWCLPQVTQWLIGTLRVGHFMIAIACAIVIGTAWAIMHVEGNRDLAKTGAIDLAAVHRDSLALAGLATAAMFLLLPILNPHAHARMLMQAGGPAYFSGI